MVVTVLRMAECGLLPSCAAWSVGRLCSKLNLKRGLYRSAWKTHDPSGPLRLFVPLPRIRSLRSNTSMQTWQPDGFYTVWFAVAINTGRSVSDSLRLPHFADAEDTTPAIVKHTKMQRKR